MKNNAWQVKAIIFDLDGTLYPLKGFNARIAWRSLRSLHLLLWMLRIRHSLRGVDLENKENFYAQFFQRFACLAKKNTRLLAAWYFDSFYPTFIALLKDKYCLRPHLPIFLEKLRTCNIKTAILSDYAFVHQRLHALALPPAAFDVIASNEEYGVLKPSQRPLLSIAAGFGLAPEAVCVIGDKADTDGEGAKLAGMPFINITDPVAFPGFYRQIMNM